MDQSTANENPSEILPSISISKLCFAMAQAQGEFPAIPKDKRVVVKDKAGNFLYEFYYADLTTIISHTRPSMLKHGLWFTQGIVKGGFATTLLHASGERYQTGFVPCEIPKNLDMKSLAGTFTYVKRISLSAAIGVSADDDVDAANQEAQVGNSTVKSDVEQKAYKEAKAHREKMEKETASVAQRPQGPTEPQLKGMYALGKGMGWTPQAIRTYCIAKTKGMTPGQLSKSWYDKLCSTLETSPYDEMQAAEVENMWEGLTTEQRALVGK